MMLVHQQRESRVFTRSTSITMSKYPMQRPAIRMFLSGALLYYLASWLCSGAVGLLGGCVHNSGVTYRETGKAHQSLHCRAALADGLITLLKPKR